MCNRSCQEFVDLSLDPAEIRGKWVLEVGSQDVNGSVRASVRKHQPAGYVGVDLREGAGVDEICDICGLTDRFGEQAMDVVITTEVLEHVRDWRAAVTNLKRVLKPGGILVVTTRSRGFPFHGYPFDFWRYETSDVEAIFADFERDRVEHDPESPGVYFRVRRPESFAEEDLSGYALYSIVSRKRCLDVLDEELRRMWLDPRFHRDRLFSGLARVCPSSLRRFLAQRVLFRNRLTENLAHA